PCAGTSEREMKLKNSCCVHGRGGCGSWPAATLDPKPGLIVTDLPVELLVSATTPLTTATCDEPGSDCTNQSVERTAAVPVAVRTSKLAGRLTGAVTVRSSPCPIA